MGYSPTVYTFPTVKPIDKETILECAEQFESIVTCEEHNEVGGFGSAIAETLAEIQGSKAKLIRIGLKDTYCTKVGSQKYLRGQYGIDSNCIVRKIKEEI